MERRQVFCLAPLRAPEKPPHCKDYGVRRNVSFSGGRDPDFPAEVFWPLESEDIERINELDLTENDLLNGYYIYNPDEETDEFVLNSASIYRFIDWGRDFTDSDDPKDVNISTTNIDDFIKYINTYENAQPGMPFFFEADGDEIISITEKPMA